MRPATLASLTLALASLACQSSGTPPVSDGDSAQRDELFAAVSSLAGEWKGAGTDEEPGHSIFTVSSAGSVVREIMLPGTDYEMTNMYALDGGELVMTHYCAAGNQPSMRADSLDDGQIVFRFSSVQDLNAEDEVYMGELTLVIVDEDTIEQRWRALKQGELDHDMVIELKRVK